MLGRKFILCSTTLGLMSIGTGAGAVPFNSFDPRSFGMGGAGVAAGTSANAVFLNPALLAAAREGEDFSLELPILGGRISDPDELIDAIDEFSDQDPIGDFSAAVDAYTATPGSITAAAVETTGDALIEQLRNLSDKALTGEGDAAVVIGIPGRKFGISILANAYLVGGVTDEVTGADLAAVQQAIDDALGTQPVTDPTDTLTSSVSARFAFLSEVGVSIAREFDVLGGIAVGLTPKYVGVRTFDYRFVGNEIDNAEIDLSQGERKDSGFNVDVGIAKDYGNGWKAGLTIRNLLAREYETALGNTFKIEPMTRLGVAHQNDWVTVAADIDLTENEPAGFDSRTQYAAVGVELDLFDTAQLRLGYRHNMSDVPAGVEQGVATAGIGFSPFGIHFDLGVAGNSDEIGAAFQLGFRF
ncbi:MAG: conjugal transfer protein TraF [Gammaproteobacteria bacterium]|nr:conjugal transfer protein TraF [Gammaproteobacteria bacterium]